MCERKLIKSFQSQKKTGGTGKNRSAKHRFLEKRTASLSTISFSEQNNIKTHY
jgi:hypothetical protein